MNTLKIWALAGAALALAACGDRNEQDSQPDARASEPAEGSQSIIRPDVDPVVAVQALSPLVTRVTFGEGGAELSEAALAELATVRESPQVAEGGPIILRGHSDAGGDGTVNKRASEARADAVAEWLIEMGVAEDRITIISFGEQNPVEPNALPDGSPNEAGRAANRRVDITVKLPAAVSEEDAAEGEDSNDMDASGEQGASE